MDSFTSWDTELCHYGIPGQRKGIRRFQNEDGSLTPAGRERYGKYDSDEKVSAKRMQKDFNHLESMYAKNAARRFTYDDDVYTRVTKAQKKGRTLDEFKQSKSGKKALKSVSEVSRLDKDAKSIERMQLRILNKAIKQNYTVDSKSVVRYRALGKNRFQKLWNTMNGGDLPVRGIRAKFSEKGDGSIKMVNYNNFGKKEDYRDYQYVLK